MFDFFAGGFFCLVPPPAFCFSFFFWTVPLTGIPITTFHQRHSCPGIFSFGMPARPFLPPSHLPTPIHHPHVLKFPLFWRLSGDFSLLFSSTDLM